ncbi:hypothetical protein VQ237_000993 [Salmonella enterica]|nr:hypothetical protein [Salmonella enterica]
MNIYNISNAKTTKEEAESLLTLRLTSTFDGGVTVNFQFNDNLNGGDYYQELFSINNPRPKESEDVIKEIMKHNIKLTVEEHTMINSFINKAGDRLVYSVTGYELSGFRDEEKRGVAMTVISRGGVATVFTFGYSVFCTKKTTNIYAHRMEANRYTRYYLGVLPSVIEPYSDTENNFIELTDVKMGCFPIDSEGHLGKTVFQFYVTKPKTPAILEDMKSHEEAYKNHLAELARAKKAEEEEKDRPRKEAEARAKQINGRLNNMRYKIKSASSWEEAAKVYQEALKCREELEEARDLWASLDSYYAPRRKPVVLPPLEEMCQLPKPEVKKPRPTLRLVA